MKNEGIKGLATIGDVLLARKVAENNALFERSITGKLDRVPSGSFPMTTAPFRSVTLIPFLTKDPETKVLYATLFYGSEKGDERHFTLTLEKDGALTGPIPREINADREDIKGELLKLIERINVDFWQTTDLDIIPQSDPGESKRGPSDIERPSRPTTDPERLIFMEKQPLAVGGFVNKTNGFRGYRVSFFPSFVVLDTDQIGNAAFVLDLPKWAMEDIEENLRAQKAGAGERLEVFERCWKPIAEQAKTKGQLADKFPGVERIVHTPKTWKKHIQEAINRHLAGSGAKR